MVLWHEVYKYDTVAEMPVTAEVKVRTKSKKSIQSPNRRGPARWHKGCGLPQRLSPRARGPQAPWGARKTRRRCCRLAGRAHTGHAGASSSAPRTHLSPAVAGQRSACMQEGKERAREGDGTRRGEKGGEGGTEHSRVAEDVPAPERSRHGRRPVADAAPRTARRVRR